MIDLPVLICNGYMMSMMFYTTNVFCQSLYQWWYSPGFVATHSSSMTDTGTCPTLSAPTITTMSYASTRDEGQDRTQKMWQNRSNYQSTSSLWLQSRLNVMTCPLIMFQVLPWREMSERNGETERNQHRGHRREDQAPDAQRHCVIAVQPFWLAHAVLYNFTVLVFTWLIIHWHTIVIFRDPNDQKFDSMRYKVHAQAYQLVQEVVQVRVHTATGPDTVLSSCTLPTWLHCHPRHWNAENPFLSAVKTKRPWVNEKWELCRLYLLVVLSTNWTSFCVKELVKQLYRVIIHT